MSKLLSNQGYNSFYDIDELPLSRDQKEMVLEWFAQKIWNGLDEPGHCKSYDPLIIEGSIAHSYIFNLDEGNRGGRHHDFESLKQLEERLVREMREYAERYPEIDNG